MSSSNRRKSNRVQWGKVDCKHNAAMLRRFWKDSSGNVTLMATLCAVPVIAAVGVGVDYARITADRSAFQSAVDSALIAVVTSAKASLTGLSQTQTADRMAMLNQMVKSFINANYVSTSGVKQSVSTSLTVTDSDVTVAATHRLPTSLMGFMGTSGLTETITSSVKKAPRPVELALVMDTTGSMKGTPLTQMKSAAHALLNNVYGGSLALKPDSQYVRIGLVPFSGAVRLNQSAYDFSMTWIDTTGASSVSRLNFSDSSWHNYMAWGKLKNTPWNGCLESRPGTFATDDSAPLIGNGDSLFVPYFAPDEPTFSNSTTNAGYYNSYVGTSGTPNELTGWTSSSPYYTTSSSLGTFSGSTTVSGNTVANSTIQLARQNNVQKYNNVSISSEASSTYGPWFNCDKTPIVPMTYNRANIENAIDAMVADGSTVIPEGLAWGWKVLSPTEPFTKVEAGPTNAATTISPYHDPHWRKIVVLMTDGQNDVLSNGSAINSLNGTWYSSYGRAKATVGNRFGTTVPTSTGAQLDSKMLALCSNIKAQGVEVFTVYYDSGSGLNSTQQANLQACATDADHATTADPTTIGAVFSNIGLSVLANNIYLSK